MRGATIVTVTAAALIRFQLTRPMRGATMYKLGKLYRTREDFNSHAPCGAQPYLSSSGLKHRQFQLTRPMRGATISDILQLRVHVLFQLTRPMRGATRNERGAAPLHNPFQLTRPMRGATQ